MILVGTKCDAPNTEVDLDTVQEVLSEIEDEDIEFYEVSAKGMEVRLYS